MKPEDKVNILLVDDQPGKLLSYEAMLSDLGENLIKASSGKEALDHLLKSDITIILMDVSMPDLDGFELASIIRQHPRYQKTAIIFVSAVHLTDLDRLKGYESGAVDYVSVPVVPALLRAKVAVFAELYRKTREFERLNRELEHRVAERTSELQEAAARLSELADRLRTADARKDEFIALLAHELRNPLAPVLHAANILRMKGYNDPELVWCRDVIERQSAQLTRLVDDLLDVSRITRGRIQLRPELIDLESIVASAVETSKPLIEASRHELVLALPSPSILVHGDPARLTQVIANLLNNAAKYQEGNGHIGLTVEREGMEAVIRVKDRGMGISPELLSQVFDLFAQGERGPDRSQGGLGIGLSLVKKLTEMHGGSVQAASEGTGRGSEFTVRLPCLPLGVRPAQPMSQVSRAVPTVPPMKILVVDDNKDAAQSMQILLTHAGHRVSVAHAGEEALRIAAAEEPAVIFLDIGLPGMDGYEVCRRVRRQGPMDVRIIAMTGYGQDRDRERSRLAGFDSHTVKPVEFTEIIRLLADAQQTGSGRRSDGE